MTSAGRRATFESWPAQDRALDLASRLRTEHVISGANCDWIVKKCAVR